MEAEELYKIIEDEGDFKYFNYGGIKCEINRNPIFKTLNGYLFISNQYILYDYSLERYNEKLLLPVHGGITFVEHFTEEIKLGFDCNHFDDLNIHTSFLIKSNVLKPPTYKDMDYVINELKNIIDYIYNEFPDTMRIYRKKKIKKILGSSK